MLLTIVIATHNRVQILKKLLLNIQAQEKVPFDVNTVIIDDGSTDGTLEMLKHDFPHSVIIRGDGNWWWTKCMNEGFKKAMELISDFVLILNDDNELKPDYLRKLADDYSRLPQSSILGSMSVSIEQEGLIEMSGTCFFKKILFKTKQYIEPYTKVDSSFTGVYPTYTLCGRGTLIPCEVFRRIGLYEEKLLQYGSDDEFILRARKNNIPTYVSWNSRVYNHTYLTSESSSIKETSFFRFTGNFFKSHTANSLKKEIYLYTHYGIPVLLPLYLVYDILGAYKSYFINFNHLKKK